MRFYAAVELKTTPSLQASVVADVRRQQQCPSFQTDADVLCIGNEFARSPFRREILSLAFLCRCFKTQHFVAIIVFYVLHKT